MDGEKFSGGIIMQSKKVRETQLFAQFDSLQRKINSGDCSKGKGFEEDKC